jgi:hypothetical protein
MELNYGKSQVSELRAKFSSSVFVRRIPEARANAPLLLDPQHLNEHFKDTVTIVSSSVSEIDKEKHPVELRFNVFITILIFGQNWPILNGV